MGSRLEYKEMGGIKQLFQTRHYIQCATVCERLLAESNEVCTVLWNALLTQGCLPRVNVFTNNILQIHPVHRAYLNFYLALSHDTMAREAKIRNRHAELELAEKHYLAAISVLTPSEAHITKTDDESASPTSSDSTCDLMHRRPSDAASLRSNHSTSTSATSVNSSFSGTPEKSATRVTFATSQLGTPQVRESMTSNPLSRTLTPIDTHLDSPAPFQGYRISTDLSAFVSMVKSHLASVRELKETPAPASNRYSFTRPRYATTTNGRPASQNSLHEEPRMDQTRGQRRSLSFRPRFDPTSVQKLCADALYEL